MNWLKEFRITRNMTQDAVADAARIKRASYGNIEVGKRRPSVEVAKRIADVLGFDWTRFYENGQDKKGPAHERAS